MFFFVLFCYFFFLVCNKEQPMEGKVQTEGIWYFLAVLSISQTICVTVGSPVGHRFPVFQMDIIILNQLKTLWGAWVESVLRHVQWAAVIFASGRGHMLSSTSLHCAALASEKKNSSEDLVSDFDWPRITDGILRDLMQSSSLSDSISKRDSEIETSEASVTQK